jgi:glycosyltransferase involved in cell wall biosynthesis
MYILITPAKNEEEALPDVINSVLSQEIKPILWLIVDDGSTDNTPHILDKLKKECKWVKTIKLPSRSRDITHHYSYVCKQGFEHAINYCKENNILYEYIGLLDADTELEENYFAKLIDEFIKNPKLGIASGGIYYNIDSKLQLLGTFENLPAGTGRMWTKECFQKTGGYLVEPSPDSISNVKAMIHGWDTRKFKNIVAIQKRFTSSAEGLWKGYKMNGYMAYYLNKHPLLILLNSVYYTTKHPHYIGTSYLYGYLVSLFSDAKQINDKDIKNYYWNTRIKDVTKTVSSILQK